MGDNRPYGFLLASLALLALVPVLVIVGARLGTGSTNNSPDAVVPLAAPQSLPPPVATGPTRLAGPAAESEATPGRAALNAAAKPAGHDPVPAKPVVSIVSGQSTQLRDSPGGDVVGRVTDRTRFGSPSVFSVRRVHGRWLGVPTELRPNGELGWIRAKQGLMTGSYTDLRIVVDLSRHTGRLLRGDHLLRKWTVTVGAPGTETPTGRFSVTDLFEGGLNSAYGCCAVALSATQPNLPSGWAGGNRIAIHGTDGPLGVDGSSGCIRSADDDVRALVEKVPLGTPVRIRE